MNILVVGGGGREHTLVWKLSQSPRTSKIYCAPGNAGIAELAQCIDISPTDLGSLAEFAESKDIDLTLVGPEAPLVGGVVDKFSKKGLRIFGPTKKAALIEGSKIFAKNIMSKYSVPSAECQEFDNPDEAIQYIKGRGVPIVVKADGLAAGKGVTVAQTEEQAIEAVKLTMVQKAFGDAGSKIIVEERLVGEEASILAFTDGRNIVPMVSSQDHKRAYDNDQGPNTGGMGAYAPAPVVTEEVMDKVMNRILKPTIEGLAKEGCNYSGVIYAGLMIKGGEPAVLEFNCRFGDPEAQVVLPLMETDLVELIMACIDGNLGQVQVKNKSGACVCVVTASGGYPGSYEKGKVIKGLEKCKEMDDLIVFHAGTSNRNGDIVTDGGRVLGVTAPGKDIKSAIDRAYEGVRLISFEGMQFRKDIGFKALERGN